MCAHVFNLRQGDRVRAPPRHVSASQSRELPARNSVDRGFRTGRRGAADASNLPNRSTAAANSDRTMATMAPPPARGFAPRPAAAATRSSAAHIMGRTGDVISTGGGVHSSSTVDTPGSARDHYRRSSADYARGARGPVSSERVRTGAGGDRQARVDNRSSLADAHGAEGVISSEGVRTGAGGNRQAQVDSAPITVRARAPGPLRASGGDNAQTSRRVSSALDGAPGPGTAAVGIYATHGQRSAGNNSSSEPSAPAAYSMPSGSRSRDQQRRTDGGQQTQGDLDSGPAAGPRHHLGRLDAGWIQRTARSDPEWLLKTLAARSADLLRLFQSGVSARRGRIERGISGC